MITSDFVLAGKAIFTVSNPQGERYTYRVNLKEATGDYQRDAYFVSLLTGSDNLRDYTYLGVLNSETGEVKLTKASKYLPDSTPVKVVRWFIKLLWNDKSLPEGYTAHHEGRCASCGKALTVPESVEAGFGPDCAERLGIPYGNKGAGSYPVSPSEDKEVVQEVTEIQEEEDHYFISDLRNPTSILSGLSPVTDREGEVTHWTGIKKGRKVTVFNG